MKTLKNLLRIAVPVLGLTFGSFQSYGQNYTEREKDTAYTALEKGFELSNYENSALQYLYASGGILNGKYTLKEELIENLSLSLQFLNKSKRMLDSCVAINYNPYKNQFLGLEMGVITYLDTNEIKKMLPEMKILMWMEETMLEDQNKINESNIKLLNERFNLLYELTEDYLKSERK